MDRKESSIVEEGGSVVDWDKGVTADFTVSVSFFMDKLMQVFYYFDDSPHDWGMVCLDVS
jgi:hypothetical protein